MLCLCIKRSYFGKVDTVFSNLILRRMHTDVFRNTMELDDLVERVDR